ncbi:MAG TPA: DUF2946 domain-containing protein [Rhodocyclaceae bacterium]|jgi:hypothetical protein|nr:DUF2946 domain-containing protein [Rhodocyclaceae bacterium]
MFSNHALRRTSLLALFVLLWGLVFPALANAGVGNAGNVWAEICTAQGVQKVQLAPGQSDGQAGNPINQGPAQHYMAHGHCVLCCIGGSLPIADVALLPVALEVQAHRIVFPALDSAVPQSVVLLNAPPRAPPFFIL